MGQLEATLQRYWGHKNFRPLQREVISAVQEGKDALVLMPTGGGKSICFQIPALLGEGLSIVVSPLIALMNDQVSQLKQRGIAAEALHSGRSPYEVERVFALIRAGKVKLLYVSPERLKSTSFQEALSSLHVHLLVVDEAHSISEWGPDFRPAYLEIGDFREQLGHVVTMALTATATPSVVEDIQQKLAMKDALLFQKSFVREGLSYIVRNVKDKEKELLRIVERVGGSGIVYVYSRKECARLALGLEGKGVNATFYHGGLSGEERRRRQELWMTGGKRIMVATNAFGMGIDKGDVRLVIHMDMPPTLEAYYQEAGRAGRDSKRAYAVVLQHDGDMASLQQRVADAVLSAAQLKGLYQMLGNYFQVAVGSHGLVGYDFDIEDFRTLYSVSTSFVEGGLRNLGALGFVDYTDNFYLPPRAEIKLSAKETYYFKVKNPLYQGLIEDLSLFYGPQIFRSLVPISLARLARKEKLELKLLKKRIKTLQELGVIHYVEGSELPKVTFLTRRYAQEEMKIPKEGIAQRRLLRDEQLGAVAAYLAHRERCRSALLVEYFGEKGAHLCGICDVCLEKKRKKKFDKTEREMVRKTILDILQGKPMSLASVLDKFETKERTLVRDEIRALMNDEVVGYDRFGRLHKSA